MKILNLVLVCSFLLSTVGVKSESYENAMLETISTMYKTKKADELTNLAGKFYRIGKTNPSEWLPLYYASYSCVSITFSLSDIDSIDSYLDKAQSYLDEGMKINSKESELYVLQALIHSKRINGAMRGMKYSGLSADALAIAEKLNNKNPRLYFCRAQNTFHTPTMFGGGKANALPIYEKALALYDNDLTASALLPHWGQEITAKMIDECKK